MSAWISGGGWSSSKTVLVLRAWAFLTFIAVLVGAPLTAAADGALAPATASTPALQPGTDLSAFRGLTVQRTEVLLDDDGSSSGREGIAIPEIRAARAGEVFEPALARAMLEEVLASGRFARGRVSVVREGAGIALVAHMVPRKLIESLRVDVHSAAVDRDELLREADLAEGGELVGKDIPVQKAKIAAVFARHGYPAPLVGITTRETDAPERVLVLVDVAPGPERRLARRVFYVFGADPRALVVDDDAYAVHEGGRADESALEAADVDLSARLRARGYHHAQVTHDVVLASGFVTLRVRVEAGPLFVAKFEGNDHFDADALTGALGLEDETDRTPGHLTVKVHDFYLKHGFLDAEVTAEVRGLETRTAFLVFHIMEHARVRVVSRAYPCLKLDDIRDLSDAPTTPSAIGNEIDSYLEDELPGADLLQDPNPRGLDSVLDGPGWERGGRPVPIDLDPDATYVPDTYERAVLHVQELYRNEGFLHAEVGPTQIVRRRCDPRSPAGRCLPVRLPHPPAPACTYDPTNLPLPAAPLDPQLTCVPDRARGATCEPTVSLYIPIELGPRSILYDLAFTGARSIPEKALGAAADLTLGEPANTLKLEAARRHIVDAYKEEGFAYVDVKYTLDTSLDHTRARARFDIIEGQRVRVKEIVLRGNTNTSEALIRRRIALVVGQPYRTSDVRKTEERIATLNVFSSVNVTLEDAYVPQETKTVVVTLVERTSQYVEVRPGLSTGEGIRFALEYGHRNLGGDAIALSLHIELSYLPDFLILDPQVKTNFDTLGPPPALDKRIATRSTATLSFPDIGLGPLVRGSIDGVFVRDLERDFALTKGAGIVNLYYRPVRPVQVSFSPDVETNDVRIFQFPSIQEYINSVQDTQGGVNPDLQRLLRVPDGASHAFAQRVVVTWDRRDNSFNAHKGTFISAGVEHVDWTANVSSCTDDKDPSTCSTPHGHTLRLTQTIAAYLPITRTITLAAEVRAGVNAQLVPGSATYPDRLFFMGGIESMRGWLQDTFLPQEYADQLARDAHKSDSDPTKFKIENVALRGGNLMINPRLELRIPVRPPFETVLFIDSGNIWLDPTYVLEHAINLRADIGTGIRVQTPIGPLAFDYGINMSRLVSSPNDPRRSYEDFGAFNFAIGLF